MNVFNNNDRDSSESDDSDDSSGLNNSGLNNRGLYDEFEQYISSETQKYKSKDYFITINSKDRNYTNNTPYNLSINFSSDNPKSMNIGKSLSPNLSFILSLSLLLTVSSPPASNAFIIIEVPVRIYPDTT